MLIIYIATIVLTKAKGVIYTKSEIGILFSSYILTHFSSLVFLQLSFFFCKIFLKYSSSL